MCKSDAKIICEKQTDKQWVEAIEGGSDDVGECVDKSTLTGQLRCSSDYTRYWQTASTPNSCIAKDSVSIRNRTGESFSVTFWTHTGIKGSGEPPFTTIDGKKVMQYKKISEPVSNNSNILVPIFTPVLITFKRTAMLLNPDNVQPGTDHNAIREYDVFRREGDDCKVNNDKYKYCMQFLGWQMKQWAPDKNESISATEKIFLFKNSSDADGVELTDAVCTTKTTSDGRELEGPSNECMPPAPSPAP